jgi:hypothetical protein
MKRGIISQLIECFTPIDWSKLRYKGIPLVIVVILVTALKIGDILTYSSVLLILCMVRRPTSRFAAYKALFALVAILIAVRGVVSSVGIELSNLLFAVRRDRGFDVTNEAGKGSGRSKTGWFTG